MSKIGVITFLHNDNFGSSLQAYALQRTLTELGHTCVHLDYQPDRKEKLMNLLKSGNSWRRVAEGMRKKKVRLEQRGAREKSRAIPDFYCRRMRLSPACRNSGELRKAAGELDTLICGSDQIWNPSWMNPVYFLNFARKEQRKIAYAASLGVSRLDNQRKIRKIRQWTRNFSGISVREREGAALMKALTGVQPAVLPDPVCLLTREEWEEIAAAPRAGMPPYLLCYFIGENPAYWERARAEAEKRGLTPLVLPVTEESYGLKWNRLDGAGPEEFIGAVRDAGMVITDSFHCLAFSAIFEKEYVLCRRDRDEDPESRNSRTDSFLKDLTEEGLARMRSKGLAWLRGQLAEESGGTE